jgi:hypothetical protein
LHANSTWNKVKSVYVETQLNSAYSIELDVLTTLRSYLVSHLVFDKNKLRKKCTISKSTKHKSITIKNCKGNKREQYVWIEFLPQLLQVLFTVFTFFVVVALLPVEVF